MDIAKLLNDTTGPAFRGGKLILENPAASYRVEGTIKSVEFSSIGPVIRLDGDSQVRITVRGSDRPARTDDLDQPLEYQNASADRLAGEDGIILTWSGNALRAKLIRPANTIQQKSKAS